METWISDWEFSSKFGTNSEEEEEITDFEPLLYMGYCAPEQICVNLGCKTYLQSDIWSLGMIFMLIFFN